MNSEEIKVTLGMDVGPLALGIRKAEHLLEEFEHSAFAKIGETILHVASVGSAVVTLEKAIAKSQSIRRESEEFGVSAGFVQDVNNIGLVAGISQEKIERMMGAFLKSLPVGADVEKSFYDLADRISGIEDPVSRAQIAFEAFGKTGYKMLPILEMGAGGIKEFGAGFIKFTDEEVNALEKAEMGLKKFENFFTVWTGRLVSTGQSIWGALSKGFEELFVSRATGKTMGWVEAFATGLGRQLTGESDDRHKAERDKLDQKTAEAQAASDAEMKKTKEAWDTISAKQREARFKGLSHEDQLAVLEDRKIALGLMISDEKTYYEYQTMIYDIDEKILDVKKKIAEEDKKKSDKIERDFEKLNAASDKWLSTNKALAHARHPDFTLEELAKSGMGFWDRSIVNRPRWFKSQGVIDAEKIEQLRTWAKQNAMSDDPGVQNLARTQWDKAEKMFDALTKKFPFLKDPQQELKEHAKKSEAHLDRLLKLADGGGGLDIAPVNGE